MFVNAHTHLYSGLAPLGMPGAGSRRRRASCRSSSASGGGSIARSTRPRCARPPATTCRREACAGTAALVDHHESPNFIEGSLDVLADACAEFGVAAVLCYGATERNGGRDEARRGLAECRRFIRVEPPAARVAASSACTRRSRCRTRRSARRATSAASWAPCSTSTSPRTAPTWTTRGAAGTRARSSGWRHSARCRPARSWRTACTCRRTQVRRACGRRLLARAEPALEREQPRRLPARPRLGRARRARHRRLRVEHARGGALRSSGSARRTARPAARLPPGCEAGWRLAEERLACRRAGAARSATHSRCRTTRRSTRKRASEAARLWARW